MSNDSTFPALGMELVKLDMRSFKAISLEVIQTAYVDISLTLQLFEKHISSSAIASTPKFYWPLIRYGRTQLCGDDLLLETCPHDGVQLDKALKPFMKEPLAVREQLLYDVTHGIYYALDLLYGRVQPGELCIRSHLRLSMATVYLSSDRRVYLGNYSLPCIRSENVLTASKNEAFQLDRTMLLVMLRYAVGLLSLSPLPKDSKVKEILDLTQNSASYPFEAILATIGIHPISFADLSHKTDTVASSQSQVPNTKSLPPSVPIPAPKLVSGSTYVSSQAQVARDGSHSFNGAIDTLNYLSTSQLRLMHLSRSVNTSQIEHEDPAAELERTSNGFYSSVCEESLLVAQVYDRALIPFETFLDIKNYYSGETRRVFVSVEKVCPTRLYVADIYRFIKDNSIKMLMQSRRVLTLLTHEDLYMQLHSRGTSELLHFLTEKDNMVLILQAALSGIFIERQVPVLPTIRYTLINSLPSFIGLFFNIPAVAASFLEDQQLISIFFNSLNNFVNQSLVRNLSKSDSADSDVRMCCLANLRLIFTILYQNYESQLFMIFSSNQFNWNALLLQMAMCPMFSKEIVPIMKSNRLRRELVNSMIQELHQITPTASFSYCSKFCICEHLRAFSQINSTLFYFFSEQITGLYNLVVALLSCRNDNIQISGELINIVATYLARLLYLDVHSLIQKKGRDPHRLKTIRPTVTRMSTIVKAIASTLGKTTTFSAQDTSRVYYGLLFICRIYCAVGYMFKYITEICLPNHDIDAIPNPFAWNFFDVPGSAHVVGSSYLGLGDITEWVAYLGDEGYQSTLKDIFTLIRGLLTPELSSLVRKVGSSDAFININTIQCLLARIRHSIIELEVLLSSMASPMPVLKDIGFTGRLMHYVESHREGKDYHEPIERPAELVLIISTLHVVVNFAVKATLTDVYISRCALMQYDVTKSPLSFSSLSISYIGQGDTEDITRSTQYTDSENFTPEVADVKKRSPTSLLKYCRLLMDRSEIIEPLCTALGLDFSIVQEAITAFDLIHVFNSYSPSSSIQL
ncbi:hypothetical protein GL50803_0021365 [Giardia duodenalis]|uniref:Uncharacterized protein n=1 Tax=Giardia intestinalis (strain ATCC 50803 / WB clone C6) TaxID=184922 RepID=D3KH75_GIAIC|nr:hypothetical protein GL50803_0021365 [Giardia intestinalis]KAE8302195.1 hypothetical protein GL50803_0021365 [Giardia intestinalis]